jgi:hypothetical protein
MVATVRDRAEIALRSLSRDEQQKVRRALRSLEGNGSQALGSSVRPKKLAGPAEGLYLLKASERIRLVLSRQGDDWVVEDLVGPGFLAVFSKKGSPA